MSVPCLDEVRTGVCMQDFIIEDSRPRCSDARLPNAPTVAEELALAHPACRCSGIHICLRHHLVQDIFQEPFGCGVPVSEEALSGNFPASKQTRYVAHDSGWHYKVESVISYLLGQKRPHFTTLCRGGWWVAQRFQSFLPALCHRPDRRNRVRSARPQTPRRRPLGTDETIQLGGSRELRLQLPGVVSNEVPKVEITTCSSACIGHFWIPGASLLKQRGGSENLVRRGPKRNTIHISCRFPQAVSLIGHRRLGSRALPIPSYAPKSPAQSQSR